jgi:hypothetical protein
MKSMQKPFRRDAAWPGRLLYEYQQKVESIRRRLYVLFATALETRRRNGEGMPPPTSTLFPLFLIKPVEHAVGARGPGPRSPNAVSHNFCHEGGKVCGQKLSPR